MRVYVCHSSESCREFLFARNLTETEAEEKLCDCGTCILLGGVQYAGSESGLAQVLDRPRSYFALKARIDRDKNTGLPLIHVSPSVVESDRKNLRGRQMNANCAV